MSALRCFITSKAKLKKKKRRKNEDNEVFSLFGITSTIWRRSMMIYQLPALLAVALSLRHPVPSAGRAAVRLSVSPLPGAPQVAAPEVAPAWWAEWLEWTPEMQLAAIVDMQSRASPEDQRRAQDAFDDAWRRASAVGADAEQAGRDAYVAALATPTAPFAALGGEGGEGGREENKAAALLRQVKAAGVAGSISYASWEVAFWAASVPVCLVAYHQATGQWPDLSDNEDKAYLGAEAFAFVNLARFVVPVRISLALATTPWVQANVVDRFGIGGGGGGGGGVQQPAAAVVRTARRCLEREVARGDARLPGTRRTLTGASRRRRRRRRRWWRRLRKLQRPRGSRASAAWFGLLLLLLLRRTRGHAGAGSRAGASRGISGHLGASGD